MQESISLGGRQVRGFALGIADPAAQKCLDSGGTLKIVNEPDGQRGICVFPDGSSCDEWAFYRGECAPKSASSGVSPTYAAAMTGAAAGLAVLVFKGPLWGAITVFSGVAIATKLTIDRVA
jgi:putative hemolysin